MKAFYIKVNINMEAIDCLRKCGKKGGEEEKQTFRCKLWIVSITRKDVKVEKWTLRQNIVAMNG